MKFSVSPSAVTNSVTFGGVVVDIGNPTSTDPVTLSIGTNPSSGVLSGTLTVNAVAGVAVFNNLQISLAGDGYTLVATAPSQLPPQNYLYNYESFQNGYFYHEPPSGDIFPVNSIYPENPHGNYVAIPGVIPATEVTTSMPFDVA